MKIKKLNCGFECYSNYRKPNKLKEWFKENTDFIIIMTSIVVALYMVHTIFMALLDNLMY